MTVLAWPYLLLVAAASWCAVALLVALGWHLIRSAEHRRASDRPPEGRAVTLPPTRRMRIEFHQGDDHPIRIPVYGDDGTAVDVTGWSARSQVRDYAGVLLHEWDTADGSIECGPEGVLLLTDESSTWAWERGLFDVVAVSPAGVQVVPGAGTITMRPLVTR